MRMVLRYSVGALMLLIVHPLSIHLRTFPRHCSSSTPKPGLGIVFRYGHALLAHIQFSLAFSPACVPLSLLHSSRNFPCLLPRQPKFNGPSLSPRFGSSPVPACLLSLLCAIFCHCPRCGFSAASAHCLLVSSSAPHMAYLHPLGLAKQSPSATCVVHGLCGILVSGCIRGP